MFIDRHAPSGPTTTPFLVTVFDDFEAARPTWARFERDAVCHVFQTHAWLRAWYDHLGRRAGIRPVFAAITDDRGGRLAFLPMGIDRRMGARVLIWLGGRASDYHGPLLGAAWAHLGEAMDMDAVCAEVRRHLPAFDAVHFEKQPECLPGGVRNPFLDLGVEDDPSWASAAHLTRPWEDFYRSRRSKKARKNISYTLRGLTKQGTLTVTIDVREPHHIDRVMAALATMKEEQLGRIGGRPLFSKPGVFDFYNDLTKARTDGARVLLSALELDDRVIAAHWGVVHGRRLYSMLPSYDPAHAASSPGLHLMLAIMEWCCETDIDVFDFALGDEAYKERWADETLALSEHLRPHRARGLGYVLRVRLARAARRRVRRVPALVGLKPAWRRWVARRKGLVRAPAGGTVAADSGVES